MTDVLSDILQTIHMRSAVFSRASLAAPWGVESGDLGTGIFHAVVSGRAHARLERSPRSVVLEKGDVVLMPFGDNHLMTDEPGRRTRLLRDLNSVDASGMGHLIVEGDGPATSLICGSVSFDQGGAHSVFSMLPPLIHVRGDHATSRIVGLIELIASEVDQGRPGADAVVARLADVLVVHMLRDYVARLPEGEVGWLAALRDPQLAMALSFMHNRPAHAWTAGELAAAVGMSRSSFFSRFKSMVGETPAHYMTRWRVHLASRMLRDEGVSAAAAGRRVGYATESAFSNAFLRVMGVRPGAYKRAA